MSGDLRRSGWYNAAPDFVPRNAFFTEQQTHNPDRLACWQITAHRKAMRRSDCSRAFLSPWRQAAQPGFDQRALSDEACIEIGRATRTSRRREQRECAAEVSWDLPSLAPGATTLIDVTVSGARAGDLAQASLVSSTRFIELNAAVWSNNTVRVMARNISAATFDLAAATLSVGVVKRRVA